MTARLNGQGLPESWVWADLNSIVVNHDGRRIPVRRSDREALEGQYPYYGASGIIDYVNDYLFDGEYLLLAEDGANLLSRSTPIAFRAFGKFWVNNHAHVLTTKGSIPQAYLEYYFAGLDLSPFVTGTAQPKLTQRNMNSIQVPVAPLNEQHRIVAAIETQFTRLDAAVTALKRSQANLKRYRAAVLKAACEGRLVPTEAELAQAEGRSYEPASVLLERILAERRRKWAAENPKKKYQEPVAPDTGALPELPEGWVWVSFDALLREPLRNGHSAKESQNGSGIRTLTLTAVTIGMFSEENTKLTVANPDKVKDLWLQAGDILIERSNAPELVGTARLYRNKTGFAIFPDLLIRARVCSNLLDEYTEIVLRSERSRRYFRSSAQGISGSMPKISQPVIQSLPIPLPPLAEQQRIVAELERRFSLITQLEKTIEADLARANRLRQSILQRAFAGQLVSQDPNDEPAAQLLERLRAANQRH